MLVGCVVLSGSTLACAAQTVTPPTTAQPSFTVSSTFSPIAADPGATDLSLLEMGISAPATLPSDPRLWESLNLLSSTANDPTPAAGGTGDGEADLADGRQGSAGVAAGLSYDGLSPTENAVTLDGLSMEQNFRGGARGSGGRGSTTGGAVNGASFGQSAVRSYRAMPGTYSAQFGDAAGAVTAIESRVGADAWHGEAVASVRSSALAAYNPFSVVTHYRDGVITNFLVRPQDTLLEIGGHMSLPLGQIFAVKHLKKNLTLFASLEAQLRNDPAIASPAMDTFYALTPTQTALLGNRDVSTAATNAALNYLDSLTGAIPRNSTRTLGFLRIDQQLHRDHLVLTYATNRFNLPAGAGFRSASNAVVNSGVASVGDSTIDVDAVAAHWLHIFSPRLAHILRAQFVRDLEFDTPRTPLPQEPAISVGGYAPEVEIAPNGFTYGTPSNLGRIAYPDEQRLQLVDELELLRRRHRFHAGFDWGRVNDRIQSFANPYGTFLYDSGVTGGHAGGLTDWITDYAFGINAYPNGACRTGIGVALHYFCYRSYTQGFGAAQTQFIMHHLAGYAEDAWHPRPDLQLTLGARYEYTLLPLPQTPNPVLDEDLRQLGPNTGLTATFPEDRNNIGPRISVAWSPRSGNLLTVHASYGVFYGRLPGATVRAALAGTALASTTLQIRIRPTTITACPQNTNVGFGYPCAYDALPPAAVQQTTSALVFAGNFRLPAIQRATLDLERTLGGHGFVRASYAMALSTQLPASVDRNIAPSSAMASFILQGGNGKPGVQDQETFSVPLYTSRRWTQYGPVTAITSSANATYHAATLESSLHGWRGLEIRGSFTYSRAIDYGPQISATPQTDTQFDPYSNGYDKGLSTLNFPRRFSGNAIYRTNVAAGPRLLRHTLNGWRASAIAVAGSGAPYSYEISGGPYLSGGHETINGSGGATYLPTVGRNTLRLPARASVDLRLERPFALSHKTHLSAFAEAFNLLNQRNLTRVETRAFLPGTPVTLPDGDTGPTPLIFQTAAAVATEGLTTPAFGQPTSSTSPLSRERQMELGLRLEF
jgi:hypothetical protein